ncbi:MAG: hypothetical protein Kow0029_24630 [Candidatus Rifleibacteriota bacterium]
MLIRAGLGLGKVTPPKWFENWLREKGILLFSFTRETLLQTIAREPLDLVFLSEDFLPDNSYELIKKIAGGIDSPFISIFISPGREDSGAGFLAAGCETVFPVSISPNTLKETIENLIQKRNEIQANSIFSSQREPRIDDFISENSVNRHFIDIARKVVGSNSSLLLLGETGVGKERLALAIHRESPRGKGPFIPINCAALPENLLESELFGHEQGAFTGAIRARRGAFELAHRGTIFLDEIGDMPLHLQAKLLRVLQDKEFQKIGGEKRIRVDVRVMAATNHNLLNAVEAGKFRKDLYYRLSVVEILIPPLRNRPEDIPGLVRKFIDQIVPRSFSGRRNVTKEAMEALVAYEWPGNVRELMNVLERAILLGDGKTIRLDDLPIEITRTGRAKERIASPAVEQEGATHFDLSLPWKDIRNRHIEVLERDYLKALLKSCSGKIGEASKKAGMTPRALHQKLSRHKICKEHFK